MLPTETCLRCGNALLRQGKKSGYFPLYILTNTTTIADAGFCFERVMGDVRQLDSLDGL